MSGSARSLQMSFFSGLRVASTNYYERHSKNGNNISQRLSISAFMNIASSANQGEGRNESITLTAWGKLADICAISMSPGKEFNCLAELHVYQGRVFHNNQPVVMQDGTTLTSKKYSFTIVRLTFGEESNKLIAWEIQSQIRPADWNTPNSPGYTTWREKLKARSATPYNPALPKFGYANVIKAQGPGIGAYVEGQGRQTQATATQVETAVANAAGSPEAVAGAFATPETVPPVQTQAAEFTTPPAGV